MYSMNYTEQSFFMTSFDQHEKI